MPDDALAKAAFEAACAGIAAAGPTVTWCWRKKDGEWYPELVPARVWDCLAEGQRDIWRAVARAVLEAAGYPMDEPISEDALTFEIVRQSLKEGRPPAGGEGVITVTDRIHEHDPVHLIGAALIALFAPLTWDDAVMVFTMAFGTEINYGVVPQRAVLAAE